MCIWRYPVDFAVHYNIHYTMFTILVREIWNDYHFFSIFVGYLWIIWVKICRGLMDNLGKNWQLINILFCGHRRRLEISLRT